VTSREPLHLSWRARAAGATATGSARKSADVARFRQSICAFFVGRWRRQPDFDSSQHAETVPSCVAVWMGCHWRSSLPRARGVAAPATLLRRLERRLDLLASRNVIGQRDSTRYAARSVGATTSQPVEQAAFRRLAVFSTAALSTRLRQSHMAICRPVASLIDKNLVRSTSGASQARSPDCACSRASALRAGELAVTGEFDCCPSTTAAGALPVQQFHAEWRGPNAHPGSNDWTWAR